MPELPEVETLRRMLDGAIPGRRIAAARVSRKRLSTVLPAAAVIVVLAAKFAEGAWVTMLLIPALLTLMVYVRKHYHNVFLETRCAAPLAVTNLAEPLVNPQPST